MALVSWPAAASTEVLVVIAQKSPAFEEALTALRSEFARSRDKTLLLQVMTAAEFSEKGPAASGRKAPRLVVTLGTDAAAAVLQRQPSTPIYCTFLPRSAFIELVSRSGADRAQLSALYLDQPFDRQLQLIRLALPARTRVGVVLGPESRQHEHGLRRAATRAGVSLRVEHISNERQLVGALYRSMDGADVLLAVPDPLVFNRNTAQSVLLTTYRLGKPVAGYSHTYVTAGALLAVYSTPSQIGRQIGEDLRAVLDKSGRQLPESGYPRYYSVAFNERVARSLGIDIRQAEVLTQQLAEGNAGVRHE